MSKVVLYLDRGVVVSSYSTDKTTEIDILDVEYLREHGYTFEEVQKLWNNVTDDMDVIVPKVINYQVEE